MAQVDYCLLTNHYLLQIFFNEWMPVLFKQTVWKLNIINKLLLYLKSSQLICIHEIIKYYDYICSWTCERSYKDEKVKVIAPTEAPLLTQLCSWNALTVVLPLILLLCDITLHQQVTHLHNKCLLASLAPKNRYRVVRSCFRSQPMFFFFLMRLVGRPNRCWLI